MSDIQKLHILNIYNWMSLEISMYLCNHTTIYAINIHHLQKFPLTIIIIIIIIIITILCDKNI